MCKNLIVLPGVILYAVFTLMGLIATLVTLFDDSVGDFFFELASSSIDFFNDLSHLIFDDKSKKQKQKI